MLVYKHCSTRSNTDEWNRASFKALFHSLKNEQVEQCLHISIVPRVQFQISLDIYLSNLSSVDDFQKYGSFIIPCLARVSKCLSITLHRLLHLLSPVQRLFLLVRDHPSL